MSYLPNIITLFRIAMAPALVLLLNEQHYIGAFLVFIIAGISDGLDGFIAKRFGYVSQVGAVLDPLADKLLLISAYVMLTVLGHIPLWLMVTVAFRDLLIIGGYLMYVSMYGPVQMRPSYLSKFNTFAQISLIVLILAVQAFGLALDGLIAALIIVVMVSTIASGSHYLWVWIIKKDVQAATESETE